MVFVGQVNGKIGREALLSTARQWWGWIARKEGEEEQEEEQEEEHGRRRVYKHTLARRAPSPPLPFFSPLPPSFDPLSPAPKNKTRSLKKFEKGTGSIRLSPPL